MNVICVNINRKSIIFNNNIIISKLPLNPNITILKHIIHILIILYIRTLIVNCNIYLSFYPANA